MKFFKTSKYKIKQIGYDVNNNINMIIVQNYIYPNEIKSNTEKQNYLIEIINQFPQQYMNDTLYVCYLLNKISPLNSSNSKYFEYQLNGKQLIRVKERINCNQLTDSQLKSLSDTQRTIYYLLMTRSANGYIRSMNLALLLEQQLEEWYLPYIMELSGSYILEMIEQIYIRIRAQNQNIITQFCLLNIEQLARNYDRMVSYWNQYYKHINGNQVLLDYTGNKLFTEIYKYSRQLRRLATMSKTWTLMVNRASVCSGDDVFGHKIVYQIDSYAINLKHFILSAFSYQAKIISCDPNATFLALVTGGSTWSINLKSDVSDEEIEIAKVKLTDKQLIDQITIDPKYQHLNSRLMKNKSLYCKLW